MPREATPRPVAMPAGMVFVGTLGRTRTANPLIRSQILYPLSYEGARDKRTGGRGEMSRSPLAAKPTQEPGSHLFAPLRVGVRYVST